MPFKDLLLLALMLPNTYRGHNFWAPANDSTLAVELIICFIIEQSDLRIYRF